MEDNFSIDLGVGIVSGSFKCTTFKLISCCAAQFLTGHGQVPVLCPEVGDPCFRLTGIKEPYGTCSVLTTKTDGSRMEPALRLYKHPSDHEQPIKNWDKREMSFQLLKMCLVPRSLLPFISLLHGRWLWTRTKGHVSWPPLIENVYILVQFSECQGLEFLLPPGESLED